MHLHSIYHSSLYLQALIHQNKNLIVTLESQMNIGNCWASPSKCITYYSEHDLSLIQDIDMMIIHLYSINHSPLYLQALLHHTSIIKHRFVTAEDSTVHNMSAAVISKYFQFGKLYRTFWKWLHHTEQYLDYEKYWRILTSSNSYYICP